MQSVPDRPSPEALSRSTNFAIVGGAMLLYVVLFYPLYAISGSYLESGAAPLSALPVVAAGLTLGMRPALAITAVTLVLNTVFLSIADQPHALAILEHHGIPAALATLVAGVVAGKLHGLHVKSRVLLAEQTALLTENEASAAHWRWLLDSAPAIVLHVDREGVIRYANQASEGAAEGLVGKTMFDLLVPDSAEEMRKLVANAFEKERSAEFDIAMDDPDQPFWYSGALGPVKQRGVVERVALVAVETTSRKMAEEALMAEAEVQHTRAEDMEAMLRIATALMFNAPFALKMEILLAEVVARADASLATFRLPDPEQSGLRLVAASGPGADTLNRPQVTPMTGFAGRAYATGSALVTSTEGDSGLPYSLSRQGVRSVAAVPVLLEGRPFGVISVLSADPDHFTPERLRFLVALCGGLGILIANANAVEEAV